MKHIQEMEQLQSQREMMLEAREAIDVRQLEEMNLSRSLALDHRERSLKQLEKDQRESLSRMLNRCESAVLLNTFDSRLWTPLCRGYTHITTRCLCCCDEMIWNFEEANLAAMLIAGRTFSFVMRQLLLGMLFAAHEACEEYGTASNENLMVAYIHCDLQG